MPAPFRWRKPPRDTRRTTGGTAGPCRHHPPGTPSLLLAPDGLGRRRRGRGPGQPGPGLRCTRRAGSRRVGARWGRGSGGAAASPLAVPDRPQPRARPAAWPGVATDRADRGGARAGRSIRRRSRRRDDAPAGRRDRGGALRGTADHAAQRADPEGRPGRAARRHRPAARPQRRWCQGAPGPRPRETARDFGEARAVAGRAAGVGGRGALRRALQRARLGRVCAPCSRTTSDSISRPTRRASVPRMWASSSRPTRRSPASGSCLPGWRIGK